MTIGDGSSLNHEWQQKCDYLQCKIIVTCNQKICTYIVHTVHVHVHIFVCLPELERTFSAVPGRENDSNTKLEDLENFAPSPLIFTRTLAAFSRSGTYTYVLFKPTCNYNIIHTATNHMPKSTCQCLLQFSVRTTSNRNDINLCVQLTPQSLHHMASLQSRVNLLF